MIDLNIGALSEPVNTLINKISGAIGILYEPKRIEKEALARAKEKEIMAITNVKVTEIEKRAVNRFIHEEIVKQENIESIIEKTLPLINDDAQVNCLSKDWLFNFFDKSKMISNDEMQYIWSKLLACESNAAGSFTKKTINIIAELEKEDAILFEEFLKFSMCFDEDNEVVIADIGNVIYPDNGITFHALSHLDRLGLITFSSLNTLQITSLPKSIEVCVNNNMYEITFSKENDNSLPMGVVMLSDAGNQLSKICNISSTKEIEDYIVSFWKSQNYLKIDKLT